MAAGGAGIKFKKGDRRAAVNKKKKAIKAKKAGHNIKKLRRAAKDESVKKRYKKAMPHIPNKWPHKAAMLQEMADTREAIRTAKGVEPIGPSSEDDSEQEHLVPEEV